MPPDARNSSTAPLRVALVGCGQIADAHLQQARRTGLARLVAVCDRELELARQAAARFSVAGAYEDVARMLREVRPDVVHISTPPASHHELLLRSLEAGAHVYVEKPFALTLRDTDEMLAAAQACGRLVCVGHDRLFDPVWLELRRRIDAGHIGAVAHMDVTQLYDLEGPFGRLVLREPDHWVHRLPGGVFQNTMPHALAAVVDLAGEDRPAVTVTSWRSGPAGIDSELHVLVRGAQTTATLTFLTTGGPSATYARVYGPSGWLEGDFEARTVRWRPALRLPSLLVKLVVPFRQSRDAVRSLAHNAARFARADLHYFEGLHTLLGAFYRAVLEKRAPPISADHIRRVAWLMDEVVGARSAMRTLPAHRLPPLELAR